MRTITRIELLGCWSDTGVLAIGLPRVANPHRRTLARRFPPLP